MTSPACRNDRKFQEMMTAGNISGRHLKEKILELLLADDPTECFRHLSLLPARQVMNPLLSFLYHDNELVRWHAVTTAGLIMGNLADRDTESARVFMRRLMWSLNEESGGIGWGAPEAMAEIMACHAGLAEEYAPVFVSYLNPKGNFVEYELLQRGVLWGLVRLAKSRPALVAGAAVYIGNYLKSSDAVVRGLAAWAAGLLQTHENHSKLRALLGDEASLRVYFDGTFVQYRVLDLAEKGLALLGQ
ncbi:MAG TPA: hypothetical protein VMC85_04820 [Desulfomonilaceae bacterium]|nr:hypothetical protein [Desulfomonilaceae bacterium]